MDKAKKDGKPFFVWHNTTRMHVWTFLSPKYQALMNSETNYGLEEAGMAQMDDSIGALLKHLDDIGEADNTIVVFTTDNGAEVFTWPDGGMTPFKGTKGTVMEGGFRAGHHPLAGQGQAGHSRERRVLCSRLVPHPRGCRRQPQHHRRTPEGRKAR
jgi:arylsulfatase A-like enzyme